MFSLRLMVVMTSPREEVEDSFDVLCWTFLVPFNGSACCWLSEMLLLRFLHLSVDIKKKRFLCEQL